MKPKKTLLAGPGALLEILRGLFFKISAILLRLRMRGKPDEEKKVSSPDISAPLARKLEKITPADNAAGIGKPGAPAVPGRKDAKESGSMQKPEDESGGGFLGTLTKYFKRRGKNTGIQPHAAEKLQKSAKEHIRSAARFARTGNKNAAKMHVELANSAAKDAARYMASAQYEEFRKEIDVQIKELN